MIRSRIYLSLVTLLTALLVLLAGWARYKSADLAQRLLPAQRHLVSALQLTDLALWSEARYTRNPAMADLFSPFQDHPGAFEHFPAGSLLEPCGPRMDTTLVVRHQKEARP